MPFAGYTDFADCVAKNSGKSDPAAYCATIKRSVEGEAIRHIDFSKILAQFRSRYGPEQGDSEYYRWIGKMGVDETKYYGFGMKESFKWLQKHVNFNIWKQDKTAKYWKVEAAFPVESMNRNVYEKRELELAGRTLKGKPVNLNHKGTISNVSIESSQYEDGPVETVLRVPLTASTNGKLVNSMIESDEIVNVSIEAEGEFGGTSGLTFSGLALLTKNVLPGIPLTRIMPLEAIMNEAFNPTSDPSHFRQVIKIKMVNEQEEVPKNVDQTDHVKPDEKGQCPEGYTLNSKTMTCQKNQPDPERVYSTSHTPKDLETSETKTLVGTPAAVETSRTGESVKEVNSLQIALYKAEQHAKALEVTNMDLMSKYKLINESNLMLEGQLKEAKQTLKTSTEKFELQIDNANKTKLEDDISKRDVGRRLEDMTTSRDEYRSKQEAQQKLNEELSQKYYKILNSDLELSRKLTASNEDYLKIAKENEDLKESLAKTKRLAKLTIKA